MDFNMPATSTPQLNHGAKLVSASQTQFRVWAPKARTLSVELFGRNDQEETLISTHSLVRDETGIFTGIVADCPAGSLYKFKLDDKPGRPDPYSRFQPFGVHGPSQVVDSNAYQWEDQDWRGIKKRDLIVYEMHVGSFTEAGTYAAAIERLDELVELGVTSIEVLPLSQTPGRWNWGYDGVNYFAPRNTFGTPDELKAFIDACHAKNLAVIIDVVYNHVGPEGNYLNEFAYYRSKKFGTPWGDSLNFCGSGCQLVREFVIANVLFWMEEYHFDGLRLDAIHYMFDDSEKFIVDEIRERFKAYEKTVDRELYLIAESNIYDSHLVGDGSGSDETWDAVWSDCLMHSIYSHGRPDLRLTNRHYQGTPDLAESLEHAYVFAAPEAIRVTDEIRATHHADENRKYIESLIMALQTHDSVGNHPHGKRLHQLTSVEYQMAAAPLILLYPSIPMIFMGEEWATEAPFPFFADFEDEGLRKAVDQGRQDEYPHHDWKGSPLPSDPEAFLATKSRPPQQKQHVNLWYRQLLELRKQGIAEGWLDVEFMTTEHDPITETFWLTYEGPRERVVICSRLLSAEAASKEPAPVTIENEDPVMVVLDSFDQAAEDPVAELEFQAQHCRIWIER
jgi:malto-oligosyltrehalose trehalohydrolase